MTPLFKKFLSVFILFSLSNAQAADKVGNGNFTYEFATQYLKIAQGRVIKFIENDYVGALANDDIKKKLAVRVVQNLSLEPQKEGFRETRPLMFDYEMGPEPKIIALKGYFEAFAFLTPENHPMFYKSLERKIWHEMSHVVFLYNDEQANDFAGNTVKECYDEIDRINQESNKHQESIDAENNTNAWPAFRLYKSNENHHYFWICKKINVDGIPYFHVIYQVANHTEQSVSGFAERLELFLFSDGFGNYSASKTLNFVRQVDFPGKRYVGTKQHTFHVELRELSDNQLYIDYDSIGGAWVKQTYTLYEQQLSGNRYVYTVPGVWDSIPDSTVRLSSNFYFVRTYGN